MQEVINVIANFLNINPLNDVYILAFLLVFVIIYSILGIGIIYESLFGVVLGISIFIVLQTLLGNTVSYGYVLPFFSQSFLQFMISSSLYLIIILSFLIPLNSFMNIKEPKNPGIKIFITILLSVTYVSLFFSIVIGLIEKIYIFKYDTAFNLMKNWSTWNNFISGSKIYQFFIENINIFVVFGTLFVIYRLIFADIVNSLIKSLINSIKGAIARKGGGGGGGDNEDDDHHGH